MCVLTTVLCLHILLLDFRFKFILTASGPTTFQWTIAFVKYCLRLCPFLFTQTQIFLLLLLLLCLCVLFNYFFLSDFLLLFSMIIIFSNNIITHERKLRSTAWVEWIHKVHAAHNEPNIHSLLSRTTSNNPPHPAQLVSMPHYVGKPTQPLGPYGSGGRNPFGPMSGNHRSASSMPVT